MRYFTTDTHFGHPLVTVLRGFTTFDPTHCWRCATPLIYKPVSSWFVSVTKIKPRLLELNQQINWIPGNVKDVNAGKAKAADVKKEGGND